MYGKCPVGQRYCVMVTGCSGSCSGAVWGNASAFTSDSRICRAARYCGINPSRLLYVRGVGGRSSYASGTANGVSTYSYGSWGESFVLEQSAEHLTFNKEEHDKFVTATKASLQQAEQAKEYALARHRAESNARVRDAEDTFNMKKRQWKEQLGFLKEELKSAKAELERVKKNGEEALEEFAEEEEKRLATWTERRDVKLNKLDEQMKENQEKKSKLTQVLNSEKSKLQTQLDQIPSKEAAETKILQDLQKKVETVEKSVEKMRERVKKALDACGGFETAVHDQLDLIRKANASLVAAGAKVASILPLVEDMMRVTDKFESEVEEEWGMWKRELAHRAKLTNKCITTGLLLNDPRHVTLEILDEKAGTRIKKLVADAAEGTATGKQLALMLK